MNDRCTPDTSARLKAAGFPQPAPAPGQFWYKYNVLLYVHCGDNRGAVCVPVNEDYTATRVFSKEDAVFAPGVADPLRALGGRACISEDSDKRFAVANNLRIKIDWEQISGTAPDWQWFDENPAEALAAAWLSENGNPADLDEF